MVTDSKKIDTSLSSLTSASAADRTKKRDTSTDGLGEADFLTLLVEQLKNQDPLDPMKNEDFAVNLAQFSQLEQLISLNDKLGAASSSSAAGLSGFLGQQVTLSNEEIGITDGKGGTLAVDVPTNAAQVTLDLLDAEGNTVESVQFGATAKGLANFELDSVGVPDGQYKFKVTALSAAGVEIPVQGRTVGIVSGFVPGSDPKLIVDGQEISLSKVARVDTPPTPNQNPTT